MPAKDNSGAPLPYDPTALKRSQGAQQVVALRNKLYERYSTNPPADWEPEWQEWLLKKPKVSRVIAQAVLDLYDGNAKATADRMDLAPLTVQHLAADPIFREIIMARKGKDIGPQIADRVARQQFWTNVINDEKASMGDRLKASELLGKSFADFTDKQILEGKILSVSDVLKTLDARAERVHPHLTHNERRAIEDMTVEPLKIEADDDFLK